MSEAHAHGDHAHRHENTIMSTAIRMKRPTGMGGAKPGEAAS